MITITTIKGETYSFDPVSERIYKGGVVLPSHIAEPVYSKTNDKDEAPKFSGILLKESNTILSITGKINYITDPNSIS